MTREKINLTVGIFMVVGLVCLAYLSVRLGKLELFGGDRYTVSADFDSVAGLKKGASVEIAGVEVGNVDAISLDPKQTGRARVRIAMNNGVRLQEDVIASVRTRGIIGDRYVLLKPGGSDALIKPGGMIRETESAVDLEDLLSKYVHGQVE